MQIDSILLHAPIRPSWAWMCAHPVRVLAFGFGSGLSRSAPGTWGTLMGWILFLGLDRLAHCPPLINLIGPAFWPTLIAFGFLIGIPICAKANRDLRVQDHGGIVWDEIVAIWLVLFILPRTLIWQAFGFLIFRLFDILKPPPIRYCDQRIHGGFGVMLDDLLAAFYALLTLALAYRLNGFFGFSIGGSYV